MQGGSYHFGVQQGYSWLQKYNKCLELRAGTCGIKIPLLQLLEQIVLAPEPGSQSSWLWEKHILFVQMSNHIYIYA